MKEFREMRRNDRQVPEDEAIRFLEKGEYGVLSTIGKDGWPYGVPLSYACVDGKIYFHSAVEGQKLDNLQHEEKASFTVVGNTHVLPAKFSTEYESVIVYGKVHFLEGDEKLGALLKLAEKYSSEYMEKARNYAVNSMNEVKVFAMDIQHLTGKRRVKKKAAAARISGE